jgi:hypothetical protein
MNFIKNYTAEEVWKIVVEHAAQNLPEGVEGDFKVRMLKDSSIEVMFEQLIEKEHLN